MYGNTEMIAEVLGVFIGLFVRVCIITLAVVMTIYFVVITAKIDPKKIGAWQAQVELGFFEEAERIGLWGEE